MQELLKISYEAENPTVSARELHDQLNIGTKFTTWFQRMTEYGFSENTDYKTCYPNLGSENHGGQNMVDYQISVDMAKEICMIQRSPEGKRIRQYFIDLEKAWNTPEQIFARALKMADKTIEELKHNNVLLGITTLTTGAFALEYFRIREWQYRKRKIREAKEHAGREAA